MCRGSLGICVFASRIGLTISLTETLKDAALHGTLSSTIFALGSTMLSRTVVWAVLKGGRTRLERIGLDVETMTAEVGQTPLVL